MFKYRLNPNFSNLKSALLEVKTLFKSGGTTIHKARNELKVIEVKDVKTVIKAFRVPNIINQFAYAYIRKSKAYKSFYNASKLFELGVSTPEPIGYIEFYRNSLLKESFFIAKEYPYQLTMANVRDDDLQDKEALLKAFATFTYEIHQKGVWHVDYSGGNILINRKDGGYEFSLVDINRMEFKTVEGYDGLENFNKMWFDEASLTTIATVYAQLAHLDVAKAIDNIVAYDAKLKAHVLRRRKLKSFFKSN